jgi:hypothetical protein
LQGLGHTCCGVVDAEAKADLLHELRRDVLDAACGAESVHSLAHADSIIADLNRTYALVACARFHYTTIGNVMP